MENLRPLLARLKLKGMEQVVESEIERAEREGSAIPEVIHRLLSPERQSPVPDLSTSRRCTEGKRKHEKKAVVFTWNYHYVKKPPDRVDLGAGEEPGTGPQATVLNGERGGTGGKSRKKSSFNRKKQVRIRSKTRRQDVERVKRK